MSPKFSTTPRIAFSTAAAAFACRVDGGRRRSVLSRNSAATGTATALLLVNGNKERIRCRTGITASDLGISPTSKYRCVARATATIRNQSELNKSNGAVTGTWTEINRGINGNVTGTVNDEKINAVAESTTFQATLEIMSQAEGKMQVRITSPGSEMTDVLIGLNRSSR